MSVSGSENAIDPADFRVLFVPVMLLLGLVFVIVGVASGFLFILTFQRNAMVPQYAEAPTQPQQYP